MSWSRHFLALLFFSAWRLFSASVEINPSADTTLIQTVPDNNMGGQGFVNSGTTQNYTTNRGLFQFDIATNIPSGSKIKSASLILEVTQEPKDGFAASMFGLHRVLKSWGEGNKVSTNSAPGLGALATTNEATWNSRFAFTTNVWTEPGAVATNDFVAIPSATEFVYGRNNSPYIFSSAQLASDIQSWLDSSENNFGWMLISQSEEQNFTARRFGSREGGFDAPRLQIEFLPPPQIESPQISSNQLTFFFNAEAGQSYTIEKRSSFHPTNSWATLTNIPASAETTRIDISEPLSSSSFFYRIVAP